MKRITLIGAVLLGFLSMAALAEEHADEALKHIKMAIEYGKAGHGPVFHQHASEALIHAQKAAEVAKGESKSHMDAAVKLLESAIEHGKVPGPEHVNAA
ncbi:MAG: small metal-binding protein SmbP, partial [Methylosarcina sp.]